MPGASEGRNRRTPSRAPTSNAASDSECWHRLCYSSPLAMRTTFRIPVLVVALGLAPGAPRAAVPHGPALAPRALLISVDGLRPDVLLRANAPALRGLMARGSFTMWARTTAVAVTLPSHVSMLTGVPPARHGVVWNSDLPLKHPVYSKFPTLFEVARHAGYTTALVTGKSKFTALNEPGTLDWAFVPDSTITDEAVADTTVTLIRRHAPQVLFVHLPGVDIAGHAKGWGSPAQLAAAARADGAIARILAAEQARGVLDSTVVLVTSDHGGQGRTHGPDDPRSRAIPWVIAGPGVRRDFDLTTIATLDVRTEDTFATLCHVLGLTPPLPVDGRPVIEALDSAPALSGR